MKIGWCTDIHLNYTDERSREAFAWKLARLPDEVRDIVITGDIAPAGHLVTELLWLREVSRPRRVLFVLGNHDFSGPGSYGFDFVRDVVVGTCASTSGLVYLHEEDSSIDLGGPLLVGVDGWWDGYGFTDPKRIDTARSISERDTRHLLSKLERVMAGRPDRLVIATHVPPFAEACWHKGRPSEEKSWGLFCNFGLGNALLAVAARHPGTQFLVLAGHTHSAATFQAAGNLVVKVLASEEGKPTVEVLEL